MAKENSMYIHFKGGLYRVLHKVEICTPDFSGTIPGIVYQNEEGKIFCRYESDFDYEGALSDGTTGKRFAEVEAQFYPSGDKIHYPSGPFKLETPSALVNKGL